MFSKQSCNDGKRYVSEIFENKLIMFFKNTFHVILFEGEKVIYGSVEREDILSSLAFKLYIWVGEILQ